MKQQTSIASNTASGLIGALAISLTMLETISKTSGNIIDITANCHRVLIIGMLDGLFTKDDVPIRRSEYAQATERSRQRFTKDDSGITNGTLTQLRSSFNKQYEALNKMATNQDLGMSMLQYPKNLVGADNLRTMLAAAEKLAKKISPSQGALYNKLTDSSTKVKAAANLTSGTVLSILFSTGKKVGKAISNTIEPYMGRPSNSILLDAIRDTYLIYDYVSEVARKTIKAPSKLLDISIATLMAFNTGIIDSAIEENNLGSNKEQLSDVANKTYLQQLKYISFSLKEGISSVYTDFKETYNFQKEKLDKLNQKVTKEDAIETILEDKPWKKPEELEARKIMDSNPLHVNITRPVIDIVKAGTKAATGTILSASFKAGKWIGRKCFAAIKQNLLQNAASVDGTQYLPSRVTRNMSKSRQI